MRPSVVREFNVVLFAARAVVIVFVRGTTRRSDVFEFMFVVAARAFVVLLTIPRLPIGAADVVFIVFDVFFVVCCVLFNLYG